MSSMSSTDGGANTQRRALWKRLAYPASVLVAAAVVGGIAASYGGRSSVAFLVMATLTLGWVVWLLFRAAHALIRGDNAAEAGVATGMRRKELDREKKALLKALKELDFDHQMGKVSDKDFADISAQYRARAIRVMRQLDDAGRDYEAMIAKDLAARVKKPEPEKGSSAVSSQLSASAPDPERCGKCGTRNDSDAEFCKKCGGKLASAEAAS
jgi:hypothetical protein